MAITRLVLTDFRNHRATTITAPAGFIVLTGENGAGKTNILEALSLLAPGRGLRRAELSAMARQGGAGGFGIAATLADGLDIATGTRADAPERRLVRVQGAATAATALAERVSVLWLTPAMDRLFTDPASERRRFLDRLTLALFPAHSVHANRYEAAMRARNRLLGEMAEGRSADPAWLAALEEQMAAHGAAIDAARRELVADLGARLAAAPEGPFARAALALEGDQVAPNALAAALASGRRRDAAAGRALVGPHRDELAVTHFATGQPAALCSTGEQKALLLGLILAHAELVAERTGRPPVLLLDEVAAHLDPRRRAALFERLESVRQVWLTGTEPALFSAIGSGARRLAVRGGAIIAD